MGKEILGEEELRARLEILEFENGLLLERSEELSIFGILSRTASEETSCESLLNNLLEQLSLLKDIEICGCGYLVENQIKVLALYTQLSDNQAKEYLNLSGGVRDSLTKGPVYITGNISSTIEFCKEINATDKKITELLLVPFSFEVEKIGVFVFAAAKPEVKQQLEMLKDFLGQFVGLTESRLTNLFLLQEYKKSNQILEKRIGLRTAELQEKNIDLLQEIKKRKKTERELEESEEKFRMIFDNANDGVILFDAEPDGVAGKCLEVNKLFLAMTRFKKEAVLSMTASELFSGLLTPYLLSASESSNRFELNLLENAGVDLDIEVIFHRFTIRGRRYILGVFRDVSERKEYEKKLVEEKQRAEESDRLKSVFLANMSHEIRTPMNAIVGFSQLLQEDDLTREETTTYLNILKAKSNELLNLINDILYLSKIEAREVVLRPENITMKEFLVQCGFHWRKLISEEKQQRLKLYIIEELSPDLEVSVDSLRLTQVLNILISNAVKFTEEGSITVQCVVDNDRIHFEIHDTGIGISPDKQKIIFGRFRQADDSQTRKYGGAGLGLAICSQLVELMDGNVGVISEQGVGSTFWFNIPMVPVKAFFENS